MRPCPLCATEDNLSLLWGMDNIVKCPTCGLVYLDTLPTLEELEEIYGTKLFKGESEYADYEGDKAILQKHFKERIAALMRYQPTGTLFEIGSAYGFFLELAQSHWEVAGVDISATAVQHAQEVLNLPVTLSDMERYPFPTEPTYDLIVMWDTIEHLYEPISVVEKCVQALKPGGILAITTGDIGARLPQFQKQSWRLFIPSHLYYFSRQSMYYLLEQRAGLLVEHFSHVGYHRSLHQYINVISHGRQQASWRHQLARSIKSIVPSKIAIPLNLYDIMFVVARKPL